MKILHILYQSLPQISGSSIRSRDILMSQKEIGLQVEAVTSPFQNSANNKDVINNIVYHRSARNNNLQISDNQKSFFLRVYKFFKIFSFYNFLDKKILHFNPQLLHAHAMFFCGLPAIFLGKKHNIPVVYELRSLWMLSKTERKSKFFKKAIEMLLMKVEIYVMKRAKVVIVINSKLADYIILKGIDKKKIYIINNAVNMSLISLNKEVELNTKIKNFGYIGTLTTHEGIDMLINAFNSLNQIYPWTKLNIYGGGIKLKELKELASKNKNINIFGSVHPSHIYDCYKEIDVIVNPRYKNELTDAVTPLKPLEALAYKKIFIGSDVGGIAEIIRNNETGFLFSAGSEEDLVNKMRMVMDMDNSKLLNLKTRSYRYVKSDKSWKSNALNYKQIYDKIIDEPY